MGTKNDVDGRDIRSWPACRMAQLGIGLVPEGRQIFPTLTVRENLLVAAANRQSAQTPWTLQAIYGLFPVLAQRRDNLGTQLSGGGQQMLAIGRALMTNPQLLILDEATEGLAPKIRLHIWNSLQNLKTMIFPFSYGWVFVMGLTFFPIMVKYIGV